MDNGSIYNSWMYSSCNSSSGDYLKLKAQSLISYYFRNDNAQELMSAIFYLSAFQKAHVPILLFGAFVVHLLLINQIKS